MLRRRFLTLTFATLLSALASPAMAQAQVTVKLASLAPEGTIWDKAMRKIASRWEQISGGSVQVKLYAGGVVGNESAMVRKIRIGQLHGGAITNLGLAEIDAAPQVTQAPMMINTYDELDHVMAEMGAEFEKRLLDKGFVVLTWGDAGWLHVFSKTPVTEPSEVGNFKIFAYEGDPEAVKMFEEMGFKPVVMASTDVMPGLQSGLIGGFPSTPLGALSLQWFALAKNMLDVPWAPLVGATVISVDAWNAIPEELHEPFLQAAREAGDEIRSEVRRQDKKAVEVMKRYGLKVTAVDAATKEKWLEMGQKSWPRMREHVVGAEVFDRMKQVLEAYRASN